MARPEWMSGRRVIDATGHPVTINIRREHIADAEPLNGQNCVAGRCALNALGAELAYFYRSVCYIAWDEDSPIVRYKLSQPLVKKVVEILDDPRRPNSEIEPGLYQLLPPPPAQRLGVDRRRKPDGELRGKRPNRPHGVVRVMGRVTAANYAWRSAS